MGTIWVCFPNNSKRRHLIGGKSLAENRVDILLNSYRNKRDKNKGGCIGITHHMDVGNKLSI
jgi:hypothetical protein